MDLSTITQITSRGGTTWHAEPGTVRTASLLTMEGRQDFLEFISGSERVFIAMPEISVITAPAERRHH